MFVSVGFGVTFSGGNTSCWLLLLPATVLGHACDCLIAVLSKTDCELNTCIVHPNPPADNDPEYTGRYPHAYEAWTVFFFQYF